MRWPFIVLAGAVAVVSTASILIRLAQAEGASSLTIAAVRLGLAAAILAPFAWMKTGREIMRLGRRELGLCLLSGLFLAMHFWTWVSSLEYTSVASSAALVTTNPLWVGLASTVLLRERPAPAALAGIALIVAGSVLIFAADSGGNERTATYPLLGNALALAGAISASGYLLVGRALRARISLTAYVWLAYTVAALLLGTAVAASGSSLAGLSGPAWGFLALLAIGPQLVGHTAFNWAVRRLTATFVAIAILGEPVGAAILAWFFFEEGFTTLQLIGFVLLLAGIFVAARGEKAPAPEKND
ncbi:MAG TPA: DMT family transporter [Burkholderiales bacterium]|jgi:drug/metabolite transporter (DMT)-like permease|nr:DMT family transporter [Burkholderiales bacterium]